MEHIGIDLGGRKSQICVRAADGEILEERAWPTHELGVFLARRPTSRVVMETCAEAFAVADMARSIGHQVRVVPATLVRSLGVGQRGIKTDVRDARVQSEASCRLDLPSVHIPSTASRHLKTVLNLRDALVRTRTQLINTCRGVLRQHLVRVPTGATQSFTMRVRSVAGALPQEFALSLEAHLGVIDVVTTRLRDARTRRSGPRRHPMLAVDDGAGSGRCHCCALRDYDRRHSAFRKRTSIAIVSRPRAGGVFKLNPPESYRPHQSRLRADSRVPSSGRLVHLATRRIQPDHRVGEENRRASRRLRCDLRNGSQSSGRALRHVAKRQTIRPRKAHSRCGVTLAAGASSVDQVPSRSAASSACCNVRCSTALARLRQCRIGSTYAPVSANTRVNTAFGSWSLMKGDGVMGTSSHVCALTDRPLHTRCEAHRHSAQRLHDAGDGHHWATRRRRSQHL